MTDSRDDRPSRPRSGGAGSGRDNSRGKPPRTGQGRPDDDGRPVDGRPLSDRPGPPKRGLSPSGRFRRSPESLTMSPVDLETCG